MNLCQPWQEFPNQRIESLLYCDSVLVELIARIDRVICKFCAGADEKHYKFIVISTTNMRQSIPVDLQDRHKPGICRQSPQNYTFH